ncbi:MAG TPA: o-succinylbenzoate synthase [Pyrinomonadaceae bacterium]|nr:o-succinylbenzoate synthase [Pyrinomonadaceae bacterium]
MKTGSGVQPITRSGIHAGIQLAGIELREIAMSLKNPFETSFGLTTERRILLIRAIDRTDHVGYGECTAMESPLFNHESIDTAWIMISRYIPAMLSRQLFLRANDIGELLSPIRGNRMAIAAVETAVWDLEARMLGKPLWQHFGGTRETINCGVSIGLQTTPDALVEKVAAEVAAGYQRIKLKIKPGKDVEYVAAVRTAFPNIALSVDANSAYEFEGDLQIFEALDEFGLLMIEQPLSAGDLLDHSRLQQRLETPICLDESITSLRDARQAIEIDACRIINIKLGRVGGHSEARAIQELALVRGIPVWCGGMLESGIGRAHNIAMSTLGGFTLPGDVSASKRYWEEDIVDPPISVSPAGTIAVPQSEGIGFRVREELVRELTVRSELIRLD